MMMKSKILRDRQTDESGVPKTHLTFTVETWRRIAPVPATSKLNFLGDLVASRASKRFSSVFCERVAQNVLKDLEGL
jgi:hypothetical protein